MRCGLSSIPDLCSTLGLRTVAASGIDVRHHDFVVVNPNHRVAGACFILEAGERSAIPDLNGRYRPSLVCDRGLQSLLRVRSCDVAGGTRGSRAFRISMAAAGRERVPWSCRGARTDMSAGGQGPEPRGVRIEAGTQLADASQLGSSGEGLLATVTDWLRRVRLVRAITHPAAWWILSITSAISRSVVYRSHRAIEST